MGGGLLGLILGLKWCKEKSSWSQQEGPRVSGPRGRTGLATLPRSMNFWWPFSGRAVLGSQRICRDNAQCCWLPSVSIFHC